MFSSSVARTAPASARCSGPMCSEPPAEFATTPWSPPASSDGLRDRRHDLVLVGDVGDDRVHARASARVTDALGGAVELVGRSDRRS